jgi:hypothetical protein
MTKQDLLQHSLAFEHAAAEFNHRANNYSVLGTKYQSLEQNKDLCLQIAQSYKWIANSIKEKD